MTTHSTALIVAAVWMTAAASPVVAQTAPTCSNHPAPTEDLAAQLAKFRPVQMPFNTSGLSTREVAMVRKLVEAGQDLESRSEEHTSELQSRRDLVCRLLLEKKKATL